MSKEAMELALEALEQYTDVVASVNDPNTWITVVDAGKPARKAITALREALAEQPAQKRPQNCGTSYCSCIECVMESAQQEQGDSICQEDDGCPTELAVLQRFWRGQSIPYEHYPTWCKPAPVPEPAAWVDEKKRIVYWHNTHDVDDYHGFKRTTPLYESPPPQRPWVGLTDEEITDMWAESSPYYHEDDFARAIEAKLKEKNT